MDSTEVGAYLTLAHAMADTADAMTGAAFRQQMVLEHKDDGTYVTETDRAVEEQLRDRIESHFPGHAVLGEEFGGDTAADAPTWIIDPIDGTNNFVSGNPVFATLIAVQIDGHEVASVVSAPALDTRWDAIVTNDLRRARMNGQAVQVSDRSLAQGQVSFGGLSYFRDSGRWEGVGRLTAATRRQRGFGDFWQHCLVAAGVIEVAVEAAVSAWDLAAVKCLVEAAGGTFSDLDGQRTIHGGSALSTNGLVHAQALELISGAGKG